MVDAVDPHPEITPIENILRRGDNILECYDG
jgi:hypothetical protein